MKSGIKSLVLIGAIVSFNSGNLVAEEKANESHANKLQLVMQGLLKDSQQLTAGIFNENFAKIEQAAKNIADHSTPGMPTMKKVIGYLGEEMPAFKGLDMTVHNTAVDIGKAARDKNMAAVVTSYHQLIDGCQSCHSQFKKRVSKILAE